MTHYHGETPWRGNKEDCFCAGQEVRVEMPPGRLYPDGFISPQPAYLTGRRSGDQRLVIVSAQPPRDRMNWPQWVHVNRLWLPEEVG